MDAATRVIVWIMALGGLAAVAVTHAFRLTDAPPTAYLIFHRLFALNDHAQALVAWLAFLACLALQPLQRAAQALAAAMQRRPLFACGVVGGVLSATSVVVGRGEPFSMDEFAVVFQAYAFASGDLHATYPPAWIDRLLWEPFQGWFLLVNRDTGHLASAYWPGFALLLAPAARLDLAWLVNPWLTAAAVWLAGELATRVASHPQARGWAMLAAVASPQLTVNAASFYAMPGLLTLNLLFAVLVLGSGRRSAFLAGVVGGWALCFHNPVPHAGVALPFLAWMACRPQRGSRLPFVLLGYLATGALLGWGWDAFIADQGLSRRAIGPSGVADGGWLARLAALLRWPSPELIEARWMAAWKVWIWSAPGLGALAVWALVRSGSVPLWLLAGGFGCTWAFYFLVPFDQGHGWGYRYAHPAWGLLPVAAGVWAASRSTTRQWPLAACCAAGLLATPVYGLQTGLTIRAELDKRIEAPAQGRWVRFVADQGRYTYDRVQNFPGRPRVLTLVGRDPAADAAFMSSHFPGARREILDARGSLWRLPEPPPDPVR